MKFRGIAGPGPLVRLDNVLILGGGVILVAAAMKADLELIGALMVMGGFFGIFIRAGIAILKR